MWTSHRISIETEVEAKGLKDKAAMIRRAIRAALAEQGLTAPCEINVLLSDDAGIRAINREQREIDKATDVLSFPMLEIKAGQQPDAMWADPGTGLLALGDMVLSLERVREQARAFGHSEARELCYLVVHSVLHLLGYDHMDEGKEKAAMRAREEEILKGLGIVRAE